MEQKVQGGVIVGFVETKESKTEEVKEVKAETKPKKGKK